MSQSTFNPHTHLPHFSLPLYPRHGTTEKPTNAYLPNTTFDIYLGGVLPSAAPDVEGATGHLSDHFAKGQEYTEGAMHPVWTSFLEDPLRINLPDGYRGGEASATTWFPDKNGIGYTVVFTERERVFAARTFSRSIWSSGTPSYSSITTLVADQADGLSQPPLADVIDKCPHRCWHSRVAADISAQQGESCHAFSRNDLPGTATCSPRVHRVDGSHRGHGAT